MRRLSLLLISAVMALTLIAFAVATGASAQQPGQPFYAAVYEGDKAFYYGDGADQQQAAEDARAGCEKADTNCTPHIWVQNGWLAIAEGTDQQGNIGYAVSFGHTEQEAVADAIQVCSTEPPPFTGCKAFDTRRTKAYDELMPTQGGAI
jgi:hypothetical protein